MSGLPQRPPRSDAEWAREVERRLRALESSPTLRAGNWVLSEQGGQLVATRPGRSVVLSDDTIEAAATVYGAPIQRMYRTLTIVGAVTGGTWSLIYRTLRTDALDDTPTANEIRDALIELTPEYSAVDFTVTGSNPTFGLWLPPGSLTADYSTLEGTDVSVRISRDQPPTP